MSGRREEIEARLRAATEPHQCADEPWKTDVERDKDDDLFWIYAAPCRVHMTSMGGEEHGLGGFYSLRRAEFAAHAPEDLRWLLDEVTRLEKELTLRGKAS